MRSGSRSGNRGSTANAAWPLYDPEAIVLSEITVVVQVNGKMRVSADPKVTEKIVVQGKLVNVVV